MRMQMSGVRVCGDNDLKIRKFLRCPMHSDGMRFLGRYILVWGETLDIVVIRTSICFSPDSFGVKSRFVCKLLLGAVGCRKALELTSELGSKEDYKRELGSVSAYLSGNAGGFSLADCPYFDRSDRIEKGRVRGSGGLQNGRKRYNRKNPSGL